MSQIKRAVIRTGEIAVALPGIGFDLLLGKITQLYAVRTINVSGNGGNLLFNGLAQVIEEFEMRFALAGSDQRFCQLPRTGATLGPVIADNGSIRATNQCSLPDELKFGGGIGPMLSLATTASPRSGDGNRTQNG
jgi:hypothetical protein